ncbi:MAG: hypothetical protein JXA64_10080 [Candidatus Fermentibacteraceae bacterium]|nr:hypothetical protein [Candidatus Fermentibacteraceae bacterium]MBN2609448.1 hypothetical protein [Candidatus Fermentibacteraceae bacterium]
MNIFVLDTDTSKCARYHSDRHVVKMTLESAQMLCTVLHENGIAAPYRPTHKHHPCTLWTGRSLSNWLWLRDLALALNQEYMYRYGRDTDHSSGMVVSGLPLPPIEDIGLTEFAQAMPEEYRIEGDPVTAYRRFYIAEKSGFAAWTGRPVPRWFAEGIRSV